MCSRSVTFNNASTRKIENLMKWIFWIFDLCWPQMAATWLAEQQGLRLATS
jgi:hypothetical protein